MLAVLMLGLLMAMQHAVEADHVAAVASIATGDRSRRRIVIHGVVWGMGHAFTLLVFVGMLIAVDGADSPRLAELLALLVGLMLVGFGGRAILRLARDRVHFHLHRHDDGFTHIHAHSHAGESGRHEPARHHHYHPHGSPLPTFLVGVMHGLAGSAALVLLTASTVSSELISIAYVAVFGIGSIVGMAFLPACIAIPLCYAGRVLMVSRNIVEALVGVGTLALGAVMSPRSAAVFDRDSSGPRNHKLQRLGLKHVDGGKTSGNAVGSRADTRDVQWRRIACTSSLDVAILCSDPLQCRIVTR